MQEGRLDPATLKVGDEVGCMTGTWRARTMKIFTVKGITPSGMIKIGDGTLYKGKYGGWFWRGEGSTVTLYTPEHARSVIKEEEAAKVFGRNRYRVESFQGWKTLSKEQLKQVAKIIGTEWEESES